MLTSEIVPVTGTVIELDTTVPLVFAAIPSGIVNGVLLVYVLHEVVTV